MITKRIGTREECRRIVHALRIEELPVLDLGCGDAPITQDLDDVRLVDILPRPTTPHGVIFKDIRQVLDLFPGEHFGTTYMIDVVEHLHKVEGYDVLRDLKSITQRIAVFTPLGALWVTPESDDPHKHRSGWTPQEFREMGFQTWEWPAFHRFADGTMFGAFWAWKDISGAITGPEEVARLSNVKP